VSGRRWQLLKACRALSNGGVIAYPTETVWGLGCDPSDEAAVRSLLTIKQRPVQKGLLLIAANTAQLEPYIVALTPAKMRKIVNTWPGPHTWLFTATERVPPWIRGEHATVAVRVTSHPLAAALCQQFGRPIVSTSANLSGYAPAKSEILVRRHFWDKVAYVLPGENGPHATPSEIRDAQTGVVVRAG